MEYLWKDRKRTFLGLPLSFTKYALDKERLFIETGLFKTVYDEVRLYRILDFQLTQTMGQKILGIGTISVVSSDKKLKEFELKNIKNPKEVKELFSEHVESERDRKRVYSREIINAPEGEDDCCHDHDHDDFEVENEGTEVEYEDM